MPVVFIHGVANREDDKSFKPLEELREQQIKKWLLVPLGEPYAGLKVVQPYWGCYGAQADGMEGLFSPLLFGGETLGPEELSMWIPDELAELPLADEECGRDDAICPTTAELTIETLLGQLTNDLGDGDFTTAHYQAIVDAAETVGENQDQMAQLDAADPQARVDLAVDLIEQALLAGPAATEPGAGESLGSNPATMFNSGLLLLPLKKAGVFVRDGFSAAFRRGKRTMSAPVVLGVRRIWGDLTFMFLGDAIKYVAQRGDADDPGEIVAEVIKGLGQDDSEPLVVITHSMGGNIFYDVLTHYIPDLRVDAWVSVGGQVALFHRFDAYHNQDFSSLQERLGCWLNVYDPIDPFAFKATSVFGELVEDFPFRTRTGAMSSHSGYFLLPRFYKRLRKRLEKRLPDFAEVDTEGTGVEQ